MAAVPKGYLRHFVLRLLNEKPMSGSELMNEIQQRTHGHWKPSPGSIYPLLSWLQDEEYAEEVPGQEPGIKRYRLTSRGQEILEEHARRRQEFRRGSRCFPPPFVGPHWLNYPEKAGKLVEAGRKLVLSSWTLLDHLREEFSDEAAANATEILEAAAEKIQAIVSELKSSQQE